MIPKCGNIKNHKLLNLHTMSKLKDEQENDRRNSIIITKEMKKEFWKHGLNSHTGFPPAKEHSNFGVSGTIYSLNDFGARISSTDGYGNK